MTSQNRRKHSKADLGEGIKVGLDKQPEIRLSPQLSEIAIQLAKINWEMTKISKSFKILANNSQKLVYS